MAKIIKTDIDIDGNGLHNGSMERLAAAPTPFEGRTYYDTVLNQERFYDGTEWQNKGVGGSGVSFIVKTLTGVDMTATGDHLIYTVPSGKVFTAQRVIVRLQTISGTGSVPKASVGANATSYDDITGNTTLSGLDTVEDAFSVSVEGTFHIAQSSTGIYIKINNSSTYTTYTADVDLIGYEI